MRMPVDLSVTIGQGIRVALLGVLLSTLVPPDAGSTGRVIPDDTWGILCILAEARGEPYEGQVAVGSVIRNRCAKKFFSDGSVVDTVTRAKQFSWMNDGDVQRTHVLATDRSTPAWQTASKAWFESEFARPVGDALLYHANSVAPWWAKAQGITFVKRIGNHLFYLNGPAK
jgi:N-acetylmuramoyl-L-alanine amidase